MAIDPKGWMLLAAVGGALWWLLADGAVSHGPGVTAARAPLQTDLDGVPGFEHLGYSITPLARFELKARVLGREDYRFDRGADLSPTDLALGWGPMSDEDVLKGIDISQGGRWYRWRARELPLARREVTRNSANMHLIPRDGEVADALDDVRTGQIIRLAGYLVEARATDGWRWRSSLTREDSGARACELVYVERFSVVEPD